MKDKIWFNYVNGKEQKVISLEKNKVKKDKWLSIEEVADSETSKKAILKGKIVFALSFIIGILILIGVIFGISYAIYVSVNTVKLDVDKNTKEIMINSSIGSKRYLIISGYKQLERIIVKNDACKYVDTVVIKNNPKLKAITTDFGSFQNTTSLTLSSIF